uniref:glycerol kinase n=1 Tax=Ditylenchus dipsaci TaxID=166011 RepID=A0A915CUI5_9BILA
MVLIGAIDQGTSSARFHIFESRTGKLDSSHQIVVDQLYPQSGACKDLKSPADQIQAIGIANQRETTIVWDKISGKPLYNAIVWLDTRTTELADEFIQKTPTKNKNYFCKKTGLLIHPYFSALKLNWLLNNVQEVKEARKKGNLMFGTVNTWLLWKLTGGEVHVTDVGNASRTLLMELADSKNWSQELCQFFDIPVEILPKIVSSAEIYGYVNEGVLKGTAITGCLPDQQAALVGHGCLQVGEAKTTFETGAFMLCNTGQQPVFSNSGLLTTIAYQMGQQEPVCYALEGAGSIGGNAVHFLKDNLHFFEEDSDVEQLAGSWTVQPILGCSARGTICGLTLNSTSAHICLATLKAIAFQTVELVEAVENDFEKLNSKVQRMKADALCKIIECAKLSEISGWGACIAAGVGAQLFKLEDVAWPDTVNYHPKNKAEEMKHELNRWKQAVQKATNWNQD